MFITRSEGGAGLSLSTGVDRRRVLAPAARGSKIPRGLKPAPLLIRQLIVWMLCLIFPVMSSLAAESHIVPAAELHQRAVSATQAHQANLAKIEKFLSLAPVQKALGTVKMSSAQVQKAVPLLSDEELARLAARADAAQADFAAGALSNEHLTYIVIALATAVIILVIVEAK